MPILRVMCGVEVARTPAKSIVNVRNDPELHHGRGTLVPGKRCGPSGVLDLPGAIGRSHLGGQGRHESEVITGPIGWGTTKRRSDAAQSRNNCARAFGHSAANASIVAQTASFAPPPRSSSLNPDVLPAGGRTQGAKLSHTPRSHTPRSHTPRSHTPRDGGYDPTKHGWYHPKARAKQAQLASAPGGNPNSREASWAYNIQKAKDHIGYAGTIGKQTSAVSREVPDWMVGVRMLDGPYVIPRFPAVEITDGKLAMNTRIFERGPYFSVKEKRATLERPRSAVAAPTATAKEKREKWVAGQRPSSAPSSRGNGGRQRPSSAPASRPPPNFEDYKGTYQTHVQENQRCLHGSFICDHHPCHPHNTLMTKGNLVGTGCVVKRTYAPKPQWVGIDPKIPGGA